jgi:hypothetical protein
MSRRRNMTGLIGNLLAGESNQLWLDASDVSTITKTYQNITPTASGTQGTKAITTSASIAHIVLPGMIIRLDGTDFYTVSAASGTSITTVEDLSDDYSGADIAIDKVSQWNDKSGNGYNAVQATGTNQPTLHTNSLNGKSTILFDTTELMTSPFVLSTQGYSVFKVIRLNAALSVGAEFVRIFRTANDNQSLSLLRVNGNYTIKSIASGASDPRPAFNYEAMFPTGTPSVITSLVALDSLEYFANGVSAAQANRSATATSLTTDTNNQIGESFRGDIAEIIIFSRIVSEAERVVINNYLMRKWGI